MIVSITTYIIVCSVFFMAGVIDAIAGGGGLITIPTMMMCGLSPHIISGTNQMACLPGAGVALCTYFKNKKIYWQVALTVTPFAMIGSYFGSKLNIYMDEKYLQIVMIVLIPVVALAVFLNKNLGKENHIEELSTKRKICSSIIIGIIIGTYVGFYGAGGGTFMLLALAIADRFDLVTASANSRFCCFFATLIAAVTYAFSGQVLWKLALCASLFNMVGNYIGANIALKKGAGIIRKMFIIVFALLFLKLISTIKTG